MTKHTARLLKEGTLPADRFTRTPERNFCLLSVEPPIQVGEKFYMYMPQGATAALMMSTRDASVLEVFMEKYAQYPMPGGNDEGVPGPSVADVVTRLLQILDDPSQI